MRKKRNPVIESVGMKLATDIIGGIGFGIGAGITERYIMRKGKKNPCRARAKTKKNIFVWNNPLSSAEQKFVLSQITGFRNKILDPKTHPAHRHDLINYVTGAHATLKGVRPKKVSNWVGTIWKEVVGKTDAIPGRKAVLKSRPNPRRPRAHVRKNIFVWNPNGKGTSIATTILQQMGGAGRLRAMIGAKNYIDHGKALSFKWPARKGPNYLKVTLTPDDTYTMEFGKIQANTYKVLGKFIGIYFDQLIPIFEQQTGLYLRMNPRQSRARYARERVASPKKLAKGSLRTVVRGSTKRRITTRKPVRRKIAANPCCGNPRHKHSLKNPLIQTVLLANGNPRRKSKRRVVAKKTRRRVAVGNPPRPPWKDGQRVPIEKARAWVNRHGSPELKSQFAQAEKLQAKANRKAKHIKWKILPIGSRTKIDAISAMVHYGQSPETLYKPPKNSKKGKHFYKHDWGDGSGKSKPLPVLTTADGRAMILPLRKGQTIDDWMRG